MRPANLGRAPAATVRTIPLVGAPPVGRARCL
jgi:hypothetical protein